MRVSFRQFLEADEPRRLAWDSNPKIGWWADADPLRVYHGTQLKNVAAIAHEGLTRLDAKTGMISFALEPFTARAFAAMGGEADFRAAGAKAKSIPPDQRATLIFELPRRWVLQHQDEDLRGNDPLHLKRLRDKAEYEAWTGNDQQYYQLCELRVNAKVPASFFVGYMIK